MSLGAELIDALTDDDLRTLAGRLRPVLAELGGDAQRGERGRGSRRKRPRRTWGSPSARCTS